MTVIELLALVETSYGATSGSSSATEILSSSKASSSATTCLNAVRDPCPTSTVPVSSTTLPSEDIFTVAPAILKVPPASLMQQLSPLPVYGLEGLRFQSMASATLSKPSLRSQSTGVSPGV